MVFLISKAQFAISVTLLTDVFISHSVNVVSLIQCLTDVIYIEQPNDIAPSVRKNTIILSVWGFTLTVLL